MEWSIQRIARLAGVSSRTLRHYGAVGILPPSRTDGSGMRWYDEASLAAVDLPGAAIVYADDAFVDRELSEQTLAHLPGVRRWLTDEWPHNGLRLDGVRILDRLLTLARGPR